MVLAGCGGGKLEDCAGSYSGTYDGDASGTLSAEVSADGAVDAAFFPSGDSDGVMGSGEIEKNGDIAFEIEGNSVKGEMDFSSCSAEGTWSYGVFASGTWEMTRD